MQEDLGPGAVGQNWQILAEPGMTQNLQEMHCRSTLVQELAQTDHFAEVVVLEEEAEP